MYSTPGGYCFSLVFIKNLYIYIYIVYDKSKHEKYFTICIVLSGASHSYL